MRGRKKSVLLRPPALVVMVALLLAVSGVLYAHWTATLNLDGNINTGSVGVSWFGAFTNDDGVDNEDGEDGTWPEVYDGTDTSADPMEPGLDPARWNKDVAECYADADGGNLSVNIQGAYPSYNCALTALVGGQGNVPVRATTTNLSALKGGFCGFFYTGTEDPYFGDWPINWDENGPFADENDNGVEDPGDIRLDDTCVGGQYEMEVRFGAIEGTFAFGLPGGPDEIEGDISAGIRCGTQVDPVPCWWALPDGTPYEGPRVGDGEGNEYVDVGNDGEYIAGTDVPQLTEECDVAYTMETSGWIHVLQPSSQNSWYQWNLSQEYVNWNEWSVEMCTPGSWVDPDGIPDNGDEYQYFPVP